jgi:hypothetical protein
VPTNKNGGNRNIPSRLDNPGLMSKQRRTWLLSEAEATAIPKKRKGGDPDAEDSEIIVEVDQTLIETLCLEDYSEPLFSLVRNNGDIAGHLKELSYNRYMTSRRRSLKDDPLELERLDTKNDHRLLFFMSGLVRQRDQRISPVYTACVSVIAYKKTLDSFFWGLLSMHRIAYSRPKVECVLDSLVLRLRDLPEFVNKSSTIGLAILDNKAYSIKLVHQHVEDAGEFLETVNIMTVPVTLQLNLEG